MSSSAQLLGSPSPRTSGPGPSPAATPEVTGSPGRRVGASSAGGSGPDWGAPPGAPAVGAATFWIGAPCWMLRNSACSPYPASGRAAIGAFLAAAQPSV